MKQIFINDLCKIDDETRATLDSTIKFKNRNERHGHYTSLTRIKARSTILRPQSIFHNSWAVYFQ